MSRQKDAEVVIGADIEDAKKKLSILRGFFKKGMIDSTEVSKANKNLRGLQEGLRNVQRLSAGKGILPRDALDKVKNFRTANDIIRDLGPTTKKSTEIMRKATSNALGKMTSDINKHRFEFQGWALSIMFFGMAISRVFNGIWKSASKTFNEVQSSVSGTTTGFQMLNGAVTYLKYTAGSALEPIAQMLIPIIDRVSDWINNNQELFRTIVVIGTVLGFVLTVVGTLVLAGFGLVQAFAKVKAALIIVKGFFIGFGAVSLGTIALIVGAALALYMAFKTNFLGIKDFVLNTFGIIWETIKGLVEDFKTIFSGVMDVLEGIFTGDFDLIMQGLKKIVVGTVTAIVRLFMNLGAIVYNSFVWILNGIKDVVITIVQLIVGAIKAAVDLIPGVDSDEGLLGDIDRGLKIMKEADLPKITAEEMARDNENLSRARDEIIVNVELDGDKVAKSTSARQQSESERFTTGSSGSWGN